MCAHTNKAVDRIMEGMIESGFADFIRVGQLEKISRKILPYSLYYTSEAEGDSSILSQLKKQLESDLSIAEASIIREELRQLEEGILNKRRDMLSTVKVVGVTCFSTNSSFLQGQTFDVVILDEASQVVEPLSILPLIRTKAKCPLLFYLNLASAEP